ncbi:MAG: hypothetical protein KKH84_07655 [Proteobacteria bacterium]|nr:hypothetical protein [Pseudomonadota bacterium]MBU4260102.1 hypothetical protein [Pseudomonadota bacterium]MBU4288892.1 hypothetical protein [Pseudomonadota bacterium]MBU4420869.1 hypothetical protein [Pseudomonadota bacterium]MCG2759108.1 hypothetical protein [Desulfobacteraceae bacterium]
MKKILHIISITFVALLLLLSLGNQKSLAVDGSGLSILAIDGNTDTNTTVDFTISDFALGAGASGTLSYTIDSGATWTDISFTTVVTPSYSYGYADLSCEGGDILDFKLQTLGTPGNVYYSYNSSDATITYLTAIASSNSKNPIYNDDYYSTILLGWNVSPAFKLDLVASNTASDGFAPVPIPASVLLLGSGILGLIAIGRVRKRDS